MTDLALLSRRADAWWGAAALAGTAVLVVPPAVEPVMLPKATLLAVLTVLFTAGWAVRAVWTRRVRIDLSAPALAALAFVAGSVVVTLAAELPLASTVGYYSRYSGLASYTAYVVLFLALLARMTPELARLLSRAYVASALVVVLYGLLQAAGVDPIGFQDIGLGTAYSTLGNVNFGGAWAGMSMAVLLATAASPDEPRPWRWLAAALLPATAVYVVVGRTSQGVVVALAGLALTAAVLLAPNARVREVWRSRRPLLLATGVAAVGALVALGVAASGAVSRQLDQALVERPDFWSAALDIWRGHPLLGTGLDSYAFAFLAARPADHAVKYGPAGADAPHSVPLAMLANGGLVLALTYAAFVVVIGVALVRAVRRCTGTARVQVAAWGGVWLGYQAQSLVSFDVPPLAAVHWIAAAVIAGLGGQRRWRTVSLPGRPVVAPRQRGRRPQPARLLVPTSTRVLLGALAVPLLAALWFIVQPLRADLLAASAADLTQQGRYTLAAARLERAASINPTEGSYLGLAARAYEAAKQPVDALSAAERAAARDPGSVLYPVLAARQAITIGSLDAARRLYDQALQRDPNDPAVLNEVAAFLVRSGDPRRAQQLYQQVLALDPGNQTARARLTALGPS